MVVKYNDLKRHHEPIKQKIEAAISDHIDRSDFIGGTSVDKFEQEFASFCETKYCIGMANGTDTILAALRALGVAAGDEVIIPANTWVSAAEAVFLAGATPVFCDVSPTTFNMRRKDVLAVISNKVVGVIATHLYGQPCEIKEIVDLARERQIWVMEDCAQAHGATVDGKKVGTFGDIASYSFYPGKNLGALGDAGALVTNKKSLKDFCVRYRNHGCVMKHQHELVGTNSRMDAIQAAVLSIKLKYLSSWNDRREAVAQMYGEKLKNCLGIKIPQSMSGYTSAWHAYVILSNERDNLRDYLSQNGIETLINYPKIIPDISPFNVPGAHEKFPNAFNCSQKILCLPIFPELQEVEVDEVTRAVTRFYMDENSSA